MREAARWSMVLTVVWAALWAAPQAAAADGVWSGPSAATIAASTGTTPEPDTTEPESTTATTEPDDTTDDRTRRHHSTDTTIGRHRRRRRRLPTATSTPRPRRSPSSGSWHCSSWRVGGWFAAPIPTQRRCLHRLPAISSERGGTRRPAPAMSETTGYRRFAHRWSGSCPGGRRGIRTHGGPKDLNSFRDCPIRPLWQPSVDRG